MGSQYFDPMSPPVVKPINEEIMEEFEPLLQSQLSGMLAYCRPEKDKKKPIDLDYKKTKSEGKAKIASKILYDYYKNKAKKRLLQNPSEMSRDLYIKLTSPSPSDLFPPETLERAKPQIHVVYNAAKKVGKKLFAASGISKVSDIRKKTFIEEVNFDSMSQKEKEIFFNDIQRECLSGFIDELYPGGIETAPAHMQLMKRCITTPGLSCPVSDIFSLLEQYIKYKYKIASDPRITTSKDLLKFISMGLPFLSAIISPYYQGESDFVEFKMFLFMLEEYTRLILKESTIRIESVSKGKDIANLIIQLLWKKLCDFVRLSGDPDIVIRTATLNNVKNFIIAGVMNFLNEVCPGGVVPGGVGRGGNRKRIKKYKNRNMTSRKTKRRTNRYKIKSRKTRKT
jgi:hypothetical protein